MAFELKFGGSLPAVVWRIGADFRAIDKWDFASELCLICRYVTTSTIGTSSRAGKQPIKWTNKTV